MHPILIKLGNIHIYTYGVFVALGLLTGLWVAIRAAKKAGINAERIMDMAFFSALAGIAGARLLYVILNIDLFTGNPLGIFKIWEGGLVFYGGFIAAAATAFVYIKKHNMPLAITTDILALAMPLGHAVGRIGCFFAGCCHGRITDLPVGVCFNDPNTLARPMGVPLHPTQLYSSAGNLLIFLILLTLHRTGRFKGKRIFVYVFLYGIFRSFIEIFRGDERGTVLVEWISTSQAIGLTAALIAAICLFALRNRDTNGRD
ncbi:MAG: prolipoprotein diacylglyceryl transferase [Thermodesulfobacteriota bacterium]|nr:prolipoprotein diacylglyceryl transferase [Thermodesulfobacteriota bacterium]